MRAPLPGTAKDFYVFLTKLLFARNKLPLISGARLSSKERRIFYAAESSVTCHRGCYLRAPHQLHGCFGPTPGLSRKEREGLQRPGGAAAVLSRRGYERRRTAQEGFAAV